jgi:hypothetical protein
VRPSRAARVLSIERYVQYFIAVRILLQKDMVALFFWAGRESGLFGCSLLGFVVPPARCFFLEREREDLFRPALST